MYCRAIEREHKDYGYGYGDGVGHVLLLDGRHLRTTQSGCNTWLWRNEYPNDRIFEYITNPKNDIMGFNICIPGSWLGKPKETKEILVTSDIQGPASDCWAKNAKHTYIIYIVKNLVSILAQLYPLSCCSKFILSVLVSFPPLTKNLNNLSSLKFVAATVLQAQWIPSLRYTPKSRSWSCRGDRLAFPPPARKQRYKTRWSGSIKSFKTAQCDAHVGWNISEMHLCLTSPRQKMSKFPCQDYLCSFGTFKTNWVVIYGHIASRTWSASPHRQFQLFPDIFIHFSHQFVPQAASQWCQEAKDPYQKKEQLAPSWHACWPFLVGSQPEPSF